MLLRFMPRHKLLVVLLLLFTSAFLVREAIFSRSIQQLVEEAYNEGGKDESENIKSTITEKNNNNHCSALDTSLQPSQTLDGYS